MVVPWCCRVQPGQVQSFCLCVQAIAPYKNKLPSSDDETEYVENLFNALCATLMTPKNRQVFVDAEGVELMVLILKQKKAVRASALKALVGPPFPVHAYTSSMHGQVSEVNCRQGILSQILGCCGLVGTGKCM